MTEILTFKKTWKLILAFLMLISGKPCFASFHVENSSIPVIQDECLINIKSLNGIYRNLTDLETTYMIQVENKGNSSVTVALSVQNQNGNCQNPDNSSNSTNVDLVLELLDAATGLPVSSAAIAPGGSFAFKVKVTASADTPIKTWSCAGVKAVSENCPESPVTLTLFSFVPDPSPEE